MAYLDWRSPRRTLIGARRGTVLSDEAGQNLSSAQVGASTHRLRRWCQQEPPRITTPIPAIASP